MFMSTLISVCWPKVLRPCPLVLAAQSGNPNRRRIRTPNRQRRGERAPGHAPHERDTPCRCRGAEGAKHHGDVHQRDGVGQDVVGERPARSAVAPEAAAPRRPGAAACSPVSATLRNCRFSGVDAARSTSSCPVLDCIAQETHLRVTRHSEFGSHLSVGQEQLFAWPTHSGQSLWR